MRIINKIKTPKDFLFFIWELPQNLLGLILIHTTRAWYSVAWEDCYFTDRIKGVYSLGSFIVLSSDFYNMKYTISKAREFRQLSKKSGWKYLFILLSKKKYQEK